MGKTNTVVSIVILLNLVCKNGKIISFPRHCRNVIQSDIRIKSIFFRHVYVANYAVLVQVQTSFPGTVTGNHSSPACLIPLSLLWLLPSRLQHNHIRSKSILVYLRSFSER